MKRVHQGFTLIEMMIVVAIIAVLASIALAIYQDYVVRSRVSEALVFADAAKVTVAENAAAAAADLGANYTPPLPSDNIDSVAIDADGVIVVTTSAAASGGSIVFQPYDGAIGAGVKVVHGAVPANGIQWDCSAGGTMIAKYRPAQCR